MSLVIRKTLLSAVILASAGFMMNAHSADADTPEVVATVNGTAITTRDLNTYARGRGQNTPPRQALISELVDRELLFQQAVTKGIDKNPEVLAELDNQRRIMIANHFISEMLAGKAPSEEEMRKFYQQRVTDQHESDSTSI